MENGAVERWARVLFAVTVMVIAVGVAAWYLWSDRHAITYQILTRDNVSGLNQDAPVEFHGVQIGKVTKVELTGPHSVRILIEVGRDAPISTATRATIISRGLSPRGFTGYVSVSLENTDTDPRGLVAPPGERFATIPANPIRDISLDAEISQANALLQALLDQATVQALKQSLDNLRQISQTLAQNNARLAALISNSEQASNALAPLLQSSGESVNALQTQLLPEAYKTLSELRELANTLKGTAAEISRNPAILLRGRARPEPGPGEMR